MITACGDGVQIQEGLEDLRGEAPKNCKESRESEAKSPLRGPGEGRVAPSRAINAGNFDYLCALDGIRASYLDALEALEELAQEVEDA